MSDVVIVALIAAAPSVVFGTINLFKIEKVHKATNSMKDALVETTRTEAHAAGMKEQAEKDQPK